MKQSCLIHTSRLVATGRKRDWVPMWLWLNVIFRFGLYDGWPFSRIVYLKYPTAPTA